MIDKIFDGVVEQSYYQTGQLERNVVLACYNNDFSVSNIEKERYSQKEDSVFFVCQDLAYDKLTCAYAPFLDIICDMFRESKRGDFGSFLEECNTYSIHKEILQSYYETGVCRRTEEIFPGEVAYEKNRMTEAIATMLIKLAEDKPIFIIINRFHLATQSSIDVIIYILEHPTANVGIVLGANENKINRGDWEDAWNRMYGHIADNNMLYHLGNTGIVRKGESIKLRDNEKYVDSLIEKLHNNYELLEFDNVNSFLSYIERQSIEEGLEIRPEWKRKMYFQFARVSIVLQNFSKTLEIVSKIRRLEDDENPALTEFGSLCFEAAALMYLGKLKQAQETIELGLDIARELEDESLIFHGELIKVQITMSGWYNIFFIVNDVPIDEAFIEKLRKYNYLNNLAHIYIYAYDNNPDTVALAYHSESFLEGFSKGVELAKAIGNGNLVCNAYQKNVMIASTNGMREVALLYTVRTLQYISQQDLWSRAHCYMSIGYNLSAMGHNGEAKSFYDRAIELFYQLGSSPDIAEANYNIALNFIMTGEYYKAEQRLEMTMKAVEKLRLNSIRVCNLSKLYALLAVVSILQGHRFDCERNLANCRQFINHVIEQGKNSESIMVVHDYSKCDDDMFLYLYASGLLAFYDGDREKAFDCFMEAENYLYKAEGNQFYVVEAYRRSRLLLFDSIKNRELYEQENTKLETGLKLLETLRATASFDILDGFLAEVDRGECAVSRNDQDMLLRNSGIEKDYLNTKKQLDFMETWQNLIDPKEGLVEDFIDNAIISFLNYFDNDRAMFVRYENNQAEVLFNNTGIRFDRDQLFALYSSFEVYPNGFAVSKISENFADHEREIAYFGLNEVCSLAAVPCYTDGKIQAVLFTYVLMKDNWHNSVNRFLLNNDDLTFFRLLFKELNNAINLNIMHSRLEESALRDMLTGLYNRVGMYREAERLEKIVAKRDKKGMAVLFLDLDNFKPYNDTFGHDIGDLVLKEMAKIFKGTAGAGSIVCRYGGDEFIIIMDTSDRDELSALAEKILSSIKNSKIFADISKEKPQVGSLGCSIGITTNDGREADTVDDMIKRADDLMYKVKSSNKGTYIFL